MPPHLRRRQLSHWRASWSTVPNSSTPEVPEMNIVVLVKHVPDATAHRRFADDGTVERLAVPGSLSELDEYAVEQALQVAESGVATQITYLTVGPDRKSTRLNSSHSSISYAVFCLKKKTNVF